MKKAASAICVAAFAASTAWGSIARAGEPLRSFMPDSLTQIKQAHAGQPFIIVLWSLDCTYCQASLEAVKAGQAKHAFRVVTIATDVASDSENRKLIDAKLDAAGLNTQRWAFGAYSEQALRYAIDPKWWGEVPRSYWMDRRGNICHRHSGVLDQEVIRKGFSFCSD